MKMPFVCKMPLAACAMLFLVACGDSDSSTSGGQHIAKTIEGVSQKGPFLNGSSVTVQELNAKTLAQTGASFEGKIKNDKGEFSVSVESLSSPYVLLKANGYFRNEVTGKKSSGQMTLYALTDLENRDEVNVNILTHLEYERTIYLVSQKVTRRRSRRFFIYGCNPRILAACKGTLDNLSPAERINLLAGLSKKRIQLVNSQKRFLMTARRLLRNYRPSR